MSVAMTPTGQKLLGAMRRNLELLVELEKVDPAGVVVIVSALVAHLRSWKPMAAVAVPTPALDSAPFELVESAAIQPDPEVSVDLGAGGMYRISIAEGLLRLQMVDVTGDETMHHFEADKAKAFRDDASKVIAAMGTVR